MKSVKRVSADLAEKYPQARVAIRKVAIVSAIGRNLIGARAAARTLGILGKAGIEPLGIHDLIRKVDLQVVIEEDDHEKAIIAMHRGLVEVHGIEVAAEAA